MHFNVINDEYKEEVRVAVHDEKWNPIEFFRFHSGHFLIGKSDERIIAYCKERLEENAKDSR